MAESYIKDYMIHLLDTVYSDDLEQLKALCYGLEHLLNSLEYKQENADDVKHYNTLTTCYLQIQEVIKHYDDIQQIPF